MSRRGSQPATARHEDAPQCYDPGEPRLTDEEWDRVNGVKSGPATPPDSRLLAKNQPCGCVVCVCEDEHQCHGCGAKNCGKHPPGQIPNPIYQDTPAQHPTPEDVDDHKDCNDGCQYALETGVYPNRVCPHGECQRALCATHAEGQTPITDKPVSLREAADRPKGSISRIHQYDADACCRRFEDLERQLAEAEDQRDRLAEALRELRNAQWLNLPGRAGDIIEAALSTLKRKESA